MPQTGLLPLEQKTISVRNDNVIANLVKVQSHTMM